jgi:hypothetical protein
MKHRLQQFLWRDGSYARYEKISAYAEQHPAATSVV